MTEAFGWETFVVKPDGNDKSEKQISINEENKLYFLDVDVVGYVKGDDGQEERYYDVYCPFGTYVSELVFDVILSGVKAQGFKQMFFKVIKRR